MIWHNCKAELKVMKTDSGFIVEWEVEKSRQRNYSIGIGGMEEPYGNPCGIHTFKTLKEALKFIEGKLT